MKNKNYIYIALAVVLVAAVSLFVLVNRGKNPGPTNPFISETDSALLNETGVVLNEIKGIAVVENNNFRTDLLQFATYDDPAGIPVAFINNNFENVQIQVISKPEGVGEIPIITLLPKQSNNVVFDTPGRYVFTLNGDNAKSLTVELIKLKGQK